MSGPANTAPTARRSFNCAGTCRPICAMGPGHCATACKLAEQSAGETKADEPVSSNGDLGPESFVKPTPQRPECFERALDFLGDPEASELRRYIEQLESAAGAVAAHACTASRVVDHGAAATAAQPQSLDAHTQLRVLTEMAYTLRLVPRGEIVPVQLLQLLRGQHDAALAARAAVLGSAAATAAQPAQDALDAARYRWLRSRASGERGGGGFQRFALVLPKPVSNVMQGAVCQHLDDAIDAAMAGPAAAATGEQP